eukprot:350306-Chlamydomonas_euryale.AAC.6
MPASSLSRCCRRLASATFRRCSSSSCATRRRRWHSERAPFACPGATSRHARCEKLNGGVQEMTFYLTRRWRSKRAASASQAAARRGTGEDVPSACRARQGAKSGVLMYEAGSAIGASQETRCKGRGAQEGLSRAGVSKNEALQATRRSRWRSGHGALPQNEALQATRRSRWPLRSRSSPPNMKHCKQCGAQDGTLVV